MNNYLDLVHTLDIAKFTSGEKSLMKEFSNEIGTSFNQTGFAIIKNHGLTTETTKILYKTMISFFDLDDE